jgi:DNA-binding transcriptional ArsR family regulator
MKRIEPSPLPVEVECIAEARRAGALLHPTRREILAQAMEPISATDIAGRIGLTRQKVNYHVQELAGAGFLQRAGRRKKRNLVEQRWVATARSYVLSPELVGPLSVDRRRIEDKLSAAYLLGLGSKLLRELGQAIREAAGLGKRLSTLSIDAELRFESAEQRAGFTQALKDAVEGVVAKHASPALGADGSPAEGRPYRLVLGCYPVPPDEEEPNT